LPFFLYVGGKCFEALLAVMLSGLTWIRPELAEPHRERVAKTFPLWPIFVFYNVQWVVHGDLPQCWLRSISGYDTAT
jgi:hypothetical protein